MPHGTRRQVRNYRRRNKDKKVEFLNRVKRESGCYICGYNKYVGALQFHHVTANKEFDLSGGTAKAVSFDKVKVEVSKCIVVCANCHAEIHAGIISGLLDVKTLRVVDDRQVCISF